MLLKCKRSGAKHPPSAESHELVYEPGFGTRIATNQKLLPHVAHLAKALPLAWPVQLPAHRSSAANPASSSVLCPTECSLLR